MKRILMGASALALCAGMAQAAGLDRSGQNISALYADDGTFSLSAGSVTPKVTGTDALGNTYDVGERYNQLSLSYTNRINDQFSYTFLMDQPYGASTTYNNNPATSMLGGTTADLSSQAFSLIGKYQVSDRFSVHGGIRAQSVTAGVTLNGLAYGLGIGAGFTAAVFNATTKAAAEPNLTTTLAAGSVSTNAATKAAVKAQIDALYPSVANAGDTVETAMSTNRANFVTNGGYQFEGEKDWSAGYLIGAAYEIPEIAFRLSATYFSEVDHSTSTTETNVMAGINGGTGTVDFVTPSALNVDFQTGIAADTLLTASYRKANYADVDVVPTNLGSDLVNLNDSERWTLGVGRRFSDAFSGSITFSYEPEGDDLVSPLGPTNGLRGVTIGGRYSFNDNMSLSGGINYSELGDANADVGGQGVAAFADNSVVGIGLKFDVSF